MPLPSLQFGNQGGIDPSAASLNMQGAMGRMGGVESMGQMGQNYANAVNQSGQSLVGQTNRLADQMAQQGRFIFDVMEGREEKREADQLAPLKGFTSSMGLQKLSTGDQSGWLDVTGSISMGASNPLLARMNNDIMQAAQQANESFFKRTLKSQAMAFEQQMLKDRYAQEFERIERQGQKDINVLDYKHGLDQQVAEQQQRVRQQAWEDTSSRFGIPNPMGGGVGGPQIPQVGGQPQMVQPPEGAIEGEMPQEPGMGLSGPQPDGSYITSDGMQIMDREAALETLERNLAPEEDIPALTAWVGQGDIANEELDNAPAGVKTALMNDAVQAGVISVQEAGKNPDRYMKTPQEIADVEKVLKTPFKSIDEMNDRLRGLKGVTPLQMSEAAYQAAGTAFVWDWKDNGEAAKISITEDARGMPKVSYSLDQGGNRPMSPAQEEMFSTAKPLIDALEELGGNIELTEEMAKFGGALDGPIYFETDPNTDGKNVIFKGRTAQGAIVDLGTYPLKYGEAFTQARQAAGQLRTVVSGRPEVTLREWGVSAPKKSFELPESVKPFADTFLELTDIPVFDDQGRPKQDKNGNRLFKYSPDQVISIIEESTVKERVKGPDGRPLKEEVSVLDPNKLSAAQARIDIENAPESEKEALREKVEAQEKLADTEEKIQALQGLKQSRQVSRQFREQQAGRIPALALAPGVTGSPVENTAQITDALQSVFAWASSLGEKIGKWLDQFEPKTDAEIDQELQELQRLRQTLQDQNDTASSQRSIP